jgi:hypothetical protein
MVSMHLLQWMHSEGNPVAEVAFRIGASGLRMVQP